MVIVAICEMCGYNLITDKHHPDGKVLVDKYGNETTIGQLKPFDGHKFTHKYPDRYITLCPNCHTLIHRCNWTLEDLRTYYSSKSKDTTKVSRTILHFILKSLNKLFDRKEKISRTEKVLYWTITGRLCDINVDLYCPICLKAW